MFKENLRVFNFLIFVSLLSVHAKDGGSDKPKLKLLSMVFRHGDRFPEPKEVVLISDDDPNLKHKVDPPGLGQLTNKGKMRAYKLGEALRKRYDDFLGSYYAPSLFAISTRVTRTEMTALTALTGMFPPDKSQIWNENLKNWQPIPIDVGETPDFRFLYPNLCPLYNKASEKASSTPEFQKEVDKYNDLIDYVSNKTGKEINGIGQLLPYYHLLESEQSLGWPLPSYTKSIFPDGKLADAASTVYNLLSFNSALKRNNGGILLARMIKFMKQAIEQKDDFTLKVMLYSAHESNVGAMLSALNFNVRPPYYTSGVALELLEHNSKYFVKILHYLGSTPTFKELTLTGCEKLCPIEKFEELLKDNLPSKDEINCKV